MIEISDDINRINTNDLVHLYKTISLRDNLKDEDIKTLLGSYSMRNINTGPKIVHPLPGEPLIEFNRWIKLPNRFIYIGLGWNIQQGFNYDLDASILTFNKMN